MKVAILGGTGEMGSAVAERLSRSHQVVIGSRDPARAEKEALKIPGATCSNYLTAAKESDVVVVAVPYSAMTKLAEVREATRGKLVVSVVNPMKLEDGLMRFSLDEGSAAEELAALLSESRVATAFNNIPAGLLRKAGDLEMDVLVAAASKDAFRETAELVKCVPGLRPLYVGPLSQAGVVERITPLVINLAWLNGTGSLATRFVESSKAREV